MEKSLQSCVWREPVEPAGVTMDVALSWLPLVWREMEEEVSPEEDDETDIMLV